MTQIAAPWGPDIQAELQHQQELDDACADYIREVFSEVPDHCHALCPWKDPWSNCIHRDKWPDCRLGDHFVEEGKI